MHSMHSMYPQTVLGEVLPGPDSLLLAQAGKAITAQHSEARSTNAGSLRASQQKQHGQQGNRASRSDRGGNVGLHPPRLAPIHDLVWVVNLGGAGLSTDI